MSYNILIVDDSDIIRTVVRKSIDMSGLDLGHVFEATNGAEALDVLHREWVDIVFADINMPVMSGMEMVEKMAADNMLVSVPVVIVSTERSDARIEELRQRGIRAYIKKPFRPENFRDAVHDILGKREETPQ